jgi:hypothetical protein
MVNVVRSSGDEEGEEVYWRRVEDRLRRIRT